MESMKIEVKQLTKSDLNDFKELISLFQEVFEHENLTTPSDIYLKQILVRTDLVIYAVYLNNNLVGGLTAYELRKYYSEESEFFIYDIAVEPEYQRNGLGKRLLSALKRHSKIKGIKEIFVAAHEEDLQAVDFYHKAHGEAEKVIHFNFPSF